ncbi:MAG: ATP-dependent helicase [Actinobacteria bacterium]|nr:ATP-dependent helicase [Actinomycetota bacterium]
MARSDAQFVDTVSRGRREDLRSPPKGGVAPADGQSLRNSDHPPTPEQERILADLSGRLRIAAGAGTGKTDTLRLALVELIEQGVRPSEILCLTFTVEATKEMRKRVLGEFEGCEGVDPDEITIQTYHAFGASIVRDNALLTGFEGDPALLDKAQKWQLFLEALDRCRFEALEIRWLPTFIPKLLALHEEMQRHVVTTAQVAEWCRSQSGDAVAGHRLEALGAVDEYARLKRERTAIDYGDQIALAAWLLEKRPEILDRLQQRFRYIFLDEYQDTDVAQRKVVKAVGERAKLVCAVGDVDQGIFGWRGATIFNMSGFPDDFPGARTEPLSTNFRSGQRILDLANALVEPFTRPGDDAREPLEAAEHAPEATIEAFVAPHQLKEAEAIAERIAAAGEPWDQYAVLCRKRTLFDPIYRALAARDVPVEVDTLGGFWTRPEILDVSAWLHLLADPGDNIALARILLAPAYRLSRRDLFFLADHAKGENREQRRRKVGDRSVLRYSLIDAIVEHDRIPELSDEARARAGELRRTWCALAATAARVSLADLVGEIARITGLAAELEGSPNPEAELALHHLAKLRDIAQGYRPVAGSTDIEGFVAYLDSIEDSDDEEDELRTPQQNAVRLMTIHRAKGLEWECVFVPGLAYEVMPSEKWSENPAKCWHRLPFELRGDLEYLPAETDEGIKQLKAEEERRLMYVAVTRAKRRLVLSRAWFYWDNKGAKEPSIFWGEALATGLVRLTDEVECPPENPYPLGIEAGPDGAAFEPPAPDPTEIARVEPEVAPLRAVELRRPRAAAWRVPSTISVTAFLTFVRDPEEFFWRYVRRVPSPPSPAAQLGIELHRRIEQHARGGVSLGGAAEDLEEPYDLDVGERQGDGTFVSPDEMWENFLNSRFAKMTPLMTEQPFTLYLGHGISVAGRIDAIFEREDGTWEIVDYKTGASDPDPLQLAIYRRAVEEIWRRDVESSWLFLRDGTLGRYDRVDRSTEVLRVAAALAHYS